MIVEALTDHCRLNRPMYTKVLAKNVTCSFCPKKEKTQVQILYQCDGQEGQSFC